MASLLSIESVIRAVTTTTAATSNSTDRAPSQAGILEGENPTVYNVSSPIILFIIQVGIIIILCRLLHWPLSKFRQPRVIAEVLVGIFLGPSIMGRVPHFKETIFPTSSMPALFVVANLGLILFLFLVALEVDIKLFLNHWRIALSVGLAGMIVPFGLGCAIAYGLYYQFRLDSGLVEISFPIYMLFIGTALSITAFPVLCRILTELNLLGTPVGVTVLAAGVGNDVVGWILLALCVVLVNNGSGITALWVLLTCVAWILFLVFAVRPAFIYYLKRTGSLRNGPSQGVVAITLLMVLTSAFFTGIIGIHPIFGAFLAGLICPHEGGFSIKLTEKIEDLVCALFLPLFFALSGLSTNLGLLNDATTWAYVVGVVGVAFAGKIIGGTLAARACKLVWRESLTIGVLMSCKGLVELIVLNVGLQAKILSERTFTIFVVMALVTTVTTTPLTSILYPASYQRKLEAWKRGDIEWDGTPLHPSGSETDSEAAFNSKSSRTQIRSLILYLRHESLPGLFTFVSLLSTSRTSSSSILHPSKKQSQAPATEAEQKSRQGLQVHGLRLVELTERTSSVMRVHETDEYARRDPIINTFRTLGQLNNVAVSGDVSVVPENSYSETITSVAAEMSSDLILLPWSESGEVSEGDRLVPATSMNVDDIEGVTTGSYNVFVQQTLQRAHCNVAVFVNRGFGGSALPAKTLQHQISVGNLSVHSQRERKVANVTDGTHHVFFPFIGGEDDRVALMFVMQLVASERVTATVLSFKTGSLSARLSKLPRVWTRGVGARNRVSSEEAGPVQGAVMGAEVAAEKQRAAEEDASLLHMVRDSLATALAERIVFEEVAAPEDGDVQGLVVGRAAEEMGRNPRCAGDLVVLGRRRSEGVAEEDAGSVQATLGRVAMGVLGARGLKASVVVVQAGQRL